jgi:hypothetical protein
MKICILLGHNVIVESIYYYENMSVKSSTELMLYVVLTMPTLNKAYLFIIIIYMYSPREQGNCRKYFLL